MREEITEDHIDVPLNQNKVVIIHCQNAFQTSSQILKDQEFHKNYSGIISDLECRSLTIEEIDRIYNLKDYWYKQATENGEALQKSQQKLTNLKESLNKFLSGSQWDFTDVAGVFEHIQSIYDGVK